jgi:hypothetical protein
MATVSGLSAAHTVIGGYCPIAKIAGLQRSGGCWIGEVSRNLPTSVRLMSKNIYGSLLDGLFRRPVLLDFERPYEPDHHGLVVDEDFIHI